jgi:Holliday junction resolvase-like predicted endonuclease
MTPLTQNPVLRVLVDDNNRVVGIATNICPIGEIDVMVTNSQTAFNVVVGIATNICPIGEIDVMVTNSQTAFNVVSKGEPFVTGAS